MKNYTEQLQNKAEQSSKIKHKDLCLPFFRIRTISKLKQRRYCSNDSKIQVKIDVAERGQTERGQNKRGQSERGQNKKEYTEIVHTERGQTARIQTKRVHTERGQTESVQMQTERVSKCQRRERRVQTKHSEVINQDEQPISESIKTQQDCSQQKMRNIQIQTLFNPKQIHKMCKSKKQSSKSNPMMKFRMKKYQQIQSSINTNYWNSVNESLILPNNHNQYTCIISTQLQQLCEQI